MKLPDLSMLKELAGVPDLIAEVLGAFRHAPEVFTDPRFLKGLIASGIDVATADGDEDRRLAIQVAIAKLYREFHPQGA